jgi:hypothetical protein
VQESSHARVAPALGCGAMGYPGQLRSGLHRQRLSVLELLGTVTSARGYCVTMPTSVLPTNMYWHRWFAWRPVFISDRAGHRRVRWLQYVERRWAEGITSGLGPRWVYRKMRAPEEWDGI